MNDGQWLITTANWSINFAIANFHKIFVNFTNFEVWNAHPLLTADGKRTKKDMMEFLVAESDKYWKLRLII